MRNIGLIIRHEIVTLLATRTFWIMTVAFPAIILLMNVGTQVMAGGAGGAQELILGPGAAAQQLAYVDESGLIQELPPGLPPEAMRAFPSTEAAGAALDDDEIAMYAIFPVDFAESGTITVVQAEFSPFDNTGEAFFSYLAAYNLTGDPAVAARLQEPLAALSAHNLAPVQPGEDTPASATVGISMVPFAVLFIFFFLITMSSGYMLRSVAREKENRTVEVLLVTVSPRQLMLGKLIGLSFIALLQMAVWVGGGMIILQGTSFFNLAAVDLGLPPGFFLWAILYLILGYLLYASLLGAVGALAPNAREGGQVTFAILLPLMIPLWFNPAITTNPNGTVAIVLSLIPLTSPVAMMTRLASGSVPLWEILLSAGLLAVTTYGLVLLAARFFRADTLLSNAALKWGRLLTAWRET